MHEVGEIVLDLALVDVDDLKAILHQELLALDGLLGLTAIITLNLAKQRRDASIGG